MARVDDAPAVGDRSAIEWRLTTFTRGLAVSESPGDVAALRRRSCTSLDCELIDSHRA